MDWAKQILLLFSVTVKVSQSLNLPTLLRFSADLAEKEIIIIIKEIYNELTNFWCMGFMYYQRLIKFFQYIEILLFSLYINYMEFNRQNIRSKVSAAETHVIDEGLRAYMLKVYNYMASGVFLTGIVSLILFQLSGGYNIQITSLGITGLTSIGNALYNSALMWVVMLAPLGIVIYMSFGIAKMSSTKAQTTFWIFAALMGASLSSIFLVYTGASITRVFFITAGTFAAMSIYGYTTKKDLTRLGSFLMMGLIGIIIASIVNIFMKSTMLYFVISIIGVLIFVGLTAYDTQKIKNMYLVSDSGEVMGKKAVMGALTLYLDFINLFIMLLRLFGQRR